MFKEINEFETLTIQTVISGVGGESLSAIGWRRRTSRVNGAGLLEFYLGASLLTVALLMGKGLSALASKPNVAPAPAPDHLYGDGIMYF